jgi:membrane-associated protease RseP (regulator of RpoE activity)
MRKHVPIAPFDICIPSAIHSPDWRTDKRYVEKPAGGRIGRIMPWAFTIFAVVLLSWGIMYFNGSGPDPLFSPIDVNRQVRPKNSGTVPWKRSGNDFGMVLLDIPTRQAALAFHVPEPGVYVLKVAKQSIANLSGVQPGDHITGLDGDTVNSVEQLTAALGKLSDGDTAELTVLRGLDRVTLTLEMDSGREQL